MSEIERDSALTEYRLAVVERRIEDLFMALKEAVGQLGGQMTALQSTMVAMQHDLPKSYQPRPEAEAVKERDEVVHTELAKRVEFVHSEVGRRLDENAKRVERMEAAMWGLLVAVLLSLGTSLFSLIRQGVGGG